MRTIRLVCAVACLVMLAACSATPDGTAPSGVTNAQSATPVGPGATPAGSPSLRAAVLGPAGFGELKLGMTRQQAEATGLIAPFQDQTVSGACSGRSQLRGAPAEEGVVFHHEQLGVAVIVAYADVKTPEGIGIGSSADDVFRAYPDWKSFSDPGERTGRGGAKVPGNAKASYLISITNAVVTDLTLAYNGHNCFN
jgi:hypothetical protein